MSLAVAWITQGLLIAIVTTIGWAAVRERE